MRTDNGPARIFPTYIVNDAPTMHSTTSAGVEVAKDDSFDACICLLTRVDFKWLMAGQGWWIDPYRFEHDRLYAAEMLGFALASPSMVLRACAVTLQVQLGEQVSH